MKPTIHKNGTSAENLMHGYEVAARRIREAMDALEWANPNARDYYTQGPDAINKAIEEQRTRIVRLKDSLKEIEDLMEHVADHM